MISATPFPVKSISNTCGCVLVLALVLCTSLATAEDALELPEMRASIDASGRFRVQFESDPSSYYKLLRIESEEVRKVIAIASGSGARLELRDPVLPAQDTIYNVVETPNAAATDSDGDGISDAVELANYPLDAPLNPAVALDPGDGSIAIQDRERFEFLARRDDVPGAQNIREVKFLMFGVDTATPTIHFFNTNRHLFHFFFARDVLDYTAGMELVLVEGSSVSDLPRSGTNQVIIGNLNGELHFRVFDSSGRRIDDLSEDQVRGTKGSLIRAMKEDLAPYWDSGIDSPELQTEIILDLNKIIENFLLTPFNADTYFSNLNRKNLAGSFIAHDSYVDDEGRAGIYTMEFWPTDPVEFRFVEKAYHALTTLVSFVDSQIAYHPASETQRTKFKLERAKFDASYIRTISTQELFGNVTYTAMNEGVGYGLLRVANAGETLTARDLVIFRSLPNDLTHVAGIITEIPQTPLSHVNLKAIQNNTPNAYVRDASTDPRIAPLIGRYVRYEVTPDGYEIREATQLEVDDFLEDLRPKEKQFPVRDLSATEITSLDDLVLNDSESFGAKAANLAELRRMLSEELTPSGYGVPFYFYDGFMIANGFYDVARTMMEDVSFQSDPAVREERLKEFRSTIKSGTAPQWMLDAIQSLHDSFPAGTSLRCRSSTNNEDLEDFNGAGLYDSYTHHIDEGHLIKSIRQVWAGMWTYRAFEERDFYRIDHFTAAMGVLVHPNYSDEQANGVAVTKNIVNPSWSGIYVNVQVGEDLVTNPEDESIPEEFLIARLNPDDWSAYEIQYVRFSNRLPEGETVLTPEQAEQLAQRLATVQARFRALYKGSSTFAMEVEFKITAEGDLIIKQARPWLE
jgi:pyruvate,water dikinase